MFKRPVLKNKTIEDFISQVKLSEKILKFFSNFEKVLIFNLHFKVF